MAETHVAGTSKWRHAIGQAVQELRRQRGWTQSHLAEHLRLSQARLSELERGKGSFSAEHLLVIMTLFNVGPERFLEHPPAEDAALQKAAARVGAFHLVVDPTVLVPGRLQSPAAVLEEILLKHPSGRWLTACAPICVWSVDEVSWPWLQSRLADAGRRRRLGWLLANTLEAGTRIRWSQRSLDWRRAWKRAELVLGEFARELQSLRTFTEDESGDILDPAIRSIATTQKVERDRSEISKEWNVLSMVKVEEFEAALAEASVAL